MDREKPFLSAGLPRSDFELFVATKVLNNATSFKRLEMLEGFILAAAEAYNDKACLELLRLLKRAYEFAAYVLAGDEITKWKPYEQERCAKILAEEKFRERIKVYYRALPKPQKDSNSLADSKLWIIKEIANQWDREVTPQKQHCFSLSL